MPKNLWFSLASIVIDTVLKKKLILFKLIHDYFFVICEVAYLEFSS